MEASGAGGGRLMRRRGGRDGAAAGDTRAIGDGKNSGRFRWATSRAAHVDVWPRRVGGMTKPGEKGE
jgi:hypothetical protein